MKTVSFTEFRANAASYLEDVERRSASTRANSGCASFASRRSCRRWCGGHGTSASATASSRCSSGISSKTSVTRPSRRHPSVPLAPCTSPPRRCGKPISSSPPTSASSPPPGRRACASGPLEGETDRPATEPRGVSGSGFTTDVSRTSALEGLGSTRLVEKRISTSHHASELTDERWSKFEPLLPKRKPSAKDGSDRLEDGRRRQRRAAQPS